VVKPSKEYKGQIPTIPLTKKGIPSNAHTELKYIKMLAMITPMYILTTLSVIPMFAFMSFVLMQIKRVRSCTKMASVIMEADIYHMTINLDFFIPAAALRALSALILVGYTSGKLTAERKK
jgi:hypothetical protein